MFYKGLPALYSFRKSAPRPPLLVLPGPRLVLDLGQDWNVASLAHLRLEFEAATADSIAANRYEKMPETGEKRQRENVQHESLDPQVQDVVSQPKLKGTVTDHVIRI